MKPKSWMAAGLLFLMSSGAWAGYMLSRRAFLSDFNSGVHAYLTGNYIKAEQDLWKAFARRPRNERVKQLLTKTLIERSFAQYHQRDFSGALETLSRTSRLAPIDEAAERAMAALRDQLATPPEKRPVEMQQVLAGLYKRLPIQDQPTSLQSLMERWLERSQANQEAVLKRYWDNQEGWLLQLQNERGEFKKILYGGLVLFGAAGLALLVLLAGILHAYLGRRGVFSRLLEEHYQRLLTALPAGTQVLLGPPVNLLGVPQTRDMDVIEAEIVSGIGRQESRCRLESLLEEEDPWVRARAAKILYRLDQKLALGELKRLVTGASSETQVPGLWALSELATTEALDLMAPLAYSPVREIQQGTVRSLLQLQSRENLSEQVRGKLIRLLSEIRSRTGWIF